MANLTDIMAKLGDPGEGHARGVRFEEAGDIVIGEVTGKSSRTTTHGTYQILTIKPDKVVESGKDTTTDDLVAVHMTGKVLNDLMENEEPAKGDQVAIRFDGKVQTADGARTYKSWSTVVDKPTMEDRLEGGPFSK